MVLLRGFRTLTCRAWRGSLFPARLTKPARLEHWRSVEAQLQQKLPRGHVSSCLVDHFSRAVHELLSRSQYRLLVKSFD